MPTIALIAGPDDDDAKSIEVSWEQWSAALSKERRTDCSPCRGHDCEAKKGRAWIPARFTDPRRVDASVAAVTLAVFDLDTPTEQQMQELAGALHGTAYLCHETHAPNSYRLILPLTEEIPAAQWPEVWRAIIARFHIPADLTCGNLSRLYFTPSKCVGADFRIATGEGPVLNWRELALSPAPDFKATTRATIGEMIAPKALEAGDINLEDMRRAVGSMRRPESRAMLDTILSGRRLTENHPRDVGYRDAAVLQACGILATAPSKPYAVESVIALMLGSIRAMDTDPEGLEHWLKVAREKYLRKVSERLERDALADEDRAAIFKILGVDQPPGAPEDWRKELIWGPKDKDGNPTGLRQTGSNAGVIFTHATEFKNSIRFNALTRDIEVISGPLKGRPPTTLDVEAKNWLAHSEFRLFLSTFEVREQLLAVARKQEYDPLREWLEQLPAWDNVDRVSDFFRVYFAAEGPDDYLRPISRCFLISCVARAMSPGCMVHTAPILVGGQGVGKSRAAEALGQPFFTDAKIQMGDKDSQLLIAGHWIVELAELAGWRAVDTETIKNFMSRRVDKFRPPYGHAPENFPRRCVFIGTTNEDEMLTDKENRRWWPVRVGNIDVSRVSKDRNQIFAQALALYRAGAEWHLTQTEALIAKAQAEHFTAPSGARSEQIVSWFSAKLPIERPVELSIFEVMSSIMGIPAAQVNRALQIEGAKALRDLGFVKIRKRIAGTLRYMYQTPKAILEMPHNAKPSHLDLLKADS